ncbi:MAG TPA: hypothetical protein VJN70_12895 [Gemmatimonadaceae bacterium]|nr:hypothetical protein [Gemmatimonadaceae bacterium]
MNAIGFGAAVDTTIGSVPNDAAMMRRVYEPAGKRRHGLAPDGTIGDATRAALHVPLEQRV